MRIKNKVAKSCNAGSVSISWGSDRKKRRKRKFNMGLAKWKGREIKTKSRGRRRIKRNILQALKDMEKALMEITKEVRRQDAVMS